MIYLPAIIPSLERKPHVTEAEAKLIWSQAKKHHIYLLIKTLWYTGLRISEAISLTASSLDVSGNQYSLWVMTEKKRKSKKRPDQVPKPDKLPIPEDLGMELSRYIMNMKLKPKARLFPGHRSTYWRQIRLCAKRAGIPQWQDIHPHSFRHGFVYYKAQKGVHPYVLSKLARHDDIRTTLGYYEPTEADLRQAMEL